ncbi:MAG: DUF6143 family protein [Acidobacteriota bacterium]
MSIFKLPEIAIVPMDLYKSQQGRYFVGYADNLTFGHGTSAVAGLFNPPNSGVKLFVNVITVTGIGNAPIRAQIWFNATPPIDLKPSPDVTPTNTALTPLPKPKVKLLETSDMEGDPIGGVKAFVRRGEAESTIVFEENGKHIFKPGGRLVVTVSNPEKPNVSMGGRIAFGWWEDKIGLLGRKKAK